MPKVDGWKVDARRLGWSHYHRDALAWFDDGDEGAAVGEYCDGRKKADVELLAAVRKYLADRGDDERSEVDFFAVEAAAMELAPKIAAEDVRPGKPIPWKKGAKAAIVHRASILAAEAMKTAQEKP